MRGFDSCYPCILNVSVYTNLTIWPIRPTTIRRKNKAKSLIKQRFRALLTLTRVKTPNRVRRWNLRRSKLRFSRKIRSFSKTRKGVSIFKHLKFFKKRHLFRTYRFRRRRRRTSLFKKTKTRNFLKHGRWHSSVLRVWKRRFRKKRSKRSKRWKRWKPSKRRFYWTKARSRLIFSKIRRLRARAVNSYTKFYIKDIRLLSTHIPTHYKTNNPLRSIPFKKASLKFISKVSYLPFSKINYSSKRNFPFVQKPIQRKKLLYNTSKYTNNLNTTLRKQGMCLKTPRLLSRRLNLLTRAGVFFQKQPNLGYTTNCSPQFLYNQGGLFYSRYTNLQHNLVCRLFSVVRQYLTSTWLISPVKNREYVQQTFLLGQTQYIRMKHTNLLFERLQLLSPTYQLVSKNNPVVIPTPSTLNNRRLNWLPPTVRYGDATFFKKMKTSLRQIRQRLRLKRSLVRPDIRRLLDFKEKAVTHATFLRINSDDTIFADTEFANVMSRLHKLPLTHDPLLQNTLFFKNTYPFYFFLNNKLNHLRSRDVSTYNVQQLNNNNLLRNPKASIKLSQHLLFFLWKIKINKPKNIAIFFNKHLSRKVKPRRSIQRFFTRLVIKRRYKRLYSRRAFRIFFKRQRWKWKKLLYKLRGYHFRKRRKLKNKLYKNRRYFRWRLPIRKNRKFFKRFAWTIRKKLRRKNTLYSYFKSRHAIEARPILKKQTFNSFTRNSTVDRSKQKMFLITSTTETPTITLYDVPKSSLFKGSYTFHLDQINLIFKNPFLLKKTLLRLGSAKTLWMLVSKQILILNKYLVSKSLCTDRLFHSTNLVPHNSFKFSVSRKIFSFLSIKSLSSRIIPWYHNNIVRFIEDATGRRVLFQFYPFMSQEVSKENIVRYKRWLPRMRYYERRLGHRFFLEEALHILHLGFSLHDAVLIGSWLKSMILRISFWKTKFIFRFLKYLFQNYFKLIFDDISVKGFKIKLKGKISAAGNSRKRTILYRVGATSHSSVNLRVVNYFQTINTFTGVMGLQVWVFY